MDKNLEALLHRKQNASDQDTEVIDWDERLQKYQAAVSELYDHIEKIFADSIAKNVVKLHRSSKQLTESYIGTYAVEDLTLTIGDEQVRFSPRGRNIVGAEGRVDLIGERDVVALILLNDSKWGFVRSRHPSLDIDDFCEASLANALESVMRS